MKALFFFLLSLILGFSSAHAAVWNDANQWSPDWELRYADWVRNNWNIHIFSNQTLPNGQSNPYFGLRTDCADTVYSMRIIFSYENKLPFVIQDPSTSGGTLSNKMSRWDSQRDADRIHNFLRYMYDIVSTHSLPYDTYPVTITRQTVHAGGMMMTVKANHHSWSIKDILPIGVPYLIFNSVLGSGTSSILQERQSWPYADWVFEGDQTPQGNAGFRYWKPLEYIHSPAWQVPGYSEEQYRIPLSNWVNFAQKRLALRQEGDSQMISRLASTVCEGMKSRVPAVSDAINFLNSTGGACMSDYATYDNYSTPSRDERIFDDLLVLRNSYKNILTANGGSQLSSDTKAQMAKIFPFINQSVLSETQKMTTQGINAQSICVLEYASNRKVDIGEFKRRIFAGLISNNPNDGMGYRWGEVHGPSSHAASCPSWDPWVPNLGQN